MLFNNLIRCCPLLFLPSIFLNVRVFSNESALYIRWPKYWSFSFNISPSNEDPGMISFRMDRLDILSVQGTFKSLLQHHCSKALILQCSAFFIVQLSHPYMTAGKTIVLTRWTDLFGTIMSLLFNMLSKLVIAFLSRSNYLLISWLQSPSAISPNNQLLLLLLDLKQSFYWTFFVEDKDLTISPHHIHTPSHVLHLSNMIVSEFELHHYLAFLLLWKCKDSHGWSKNTAR